MQVQPQQGDQHRVTYHLGKLPLASPGAGSAFTDNRRGKITASTWVRYWERSRLAVGRVSINRYLEPSVDLPLKLPFEFFGRIISTSE